MREQTFPRTSPVRQLDVFAIYAMPRDHFLLLDQETGAQSLFDALPPALAAALALHQAKVDEKNRRGSAWICATEDVAAT